MQQIARPIRRKEPVAGTKSKKLDLKLRVKNFGPVYEGDIHLRPLTLFVGPNNSGKSYIAMLVHSLFEAHPAGRVAKSFRLMPSGGLYLPTLTEPFLDASGKCGHILEWARGLKIGVPSELSGEGLDTLGDVVAGIYAGSLDQEVTRAYACTQGKLVSLGKRSFEIILGADPHLLNLKSSRGEIRAVFVPHLSAGLSLAMTLRDSEGGPLNVRTHGRRLLVETDRSFLEQTSFKYAMSNLLLHLLLSEPFPSIIMRSHYLPAARSGILQGHKVLTASMWRQLPLIGTEQIDIPAFSGVVSEFLSNIVSLSDRPGPLFELARHFEGELIGGEILRTTTDKSRHPDIVYKFGNSEIPLHRSSSAVSELAPLFLYLKYILSPGDVLIIEEPETHLHPGNQVVMARLLARLVREGLNVLITTHSDFMIEQLSTLVLAGEKSKRSEASPDEFLTRDEVAAYVFGYRAKKASYRIDPLHIGSEEGISQEEFMKVHEALYEESFRIRRELSAEDDPVCKP